MKTLEAWMSAKNVQGGTIHQMMTDLLESLRHKEIETDNDPFRWGVREGERNEFFSDISRYSVPTNSWREKDNIKFTMSYLAGLWCGLETVRISQALMKDWVVDDA